MATTHYTHFSQSFSWYRIVRRIAILATPPSITIMIALWVIFQLNYNNTLRIIEISEANRIDLLTNVISDKFDHIASELAIIAQSSVLEAVIADNTAENRQALAASFQSISENTGYYDQVRYLDATGMEIVRVNYVDGEAVAVPDDGLQPKGDRYYFQDTMILNAGEIFVSPFDLNIEQGQIEQPIKPIIRFGTPVYTAEGQPAGIVILNYLGDLMLEHMERVTTENDAQTMLVNSEGYWLSHPNPEFVWGFMYPESSNLTFANLYPDVWAALSEQEAQHIHNNGIYTYTTIYPLEETWNSSTGAPTAFAPSDAPLGADEYTWQLISFVPSDSLSPWELGDLMTLVVIGLAFVVVFVVASYPIAVFQERNDAAERQMNTTFTVMAEGVVTHNKDGSIIAANSAAERILGLSHDALFGKTSIDPHWRAVQDNGTDFPGETHPAMMALKTGETQQNVIMGVHKPDDTLTWISVNSEPMFANGDTSPYAAVTTFTDITAIREAQEQMVALAVERERVKLITNFIRDASHEFRTPLAVISSSVYFVAKSPDEERRQHHHDKIISQIHRVTRLVDMLLLMAKLDGRFDFNLQNIRLNDLIRQVTLSLQPISEDKQIALQEHLPEESIMLDAAPEYLKDALYYVLENALRYTPASGEVSISAEIVDDNTIKIMVQDNGEGIAAEHLPHIFDPFWRLDDAHNEPGFGLGLPIAEKVIDLHHGDIQVSSTPGTGTIVTIILHVNHPQG